MKILFLERHYTENGIFEAFDMGLDTAFYVLERTAGLPYDDRMEILREVKKRIEDGKMND